MSFENGSHVTINGIEYPLDEGYEALTNRRCYVHGGRSIFAEQFSPGGQTGRNVRQDRLLWYQTQFNGEGQVVLDGDDPDSFGLFYRSEGLDFRTPGEAKLNKSIVSQAVTVSAGATTTDQGDTFTDVTGTSTDSGTDTRLNSLNDKVQSPTNFAPGATVAVASFYLYREPFADYATTIQGSAFTLGSGTGMVTGTDLQLGKDGAATSGSLSVSTGVNTRVEFFLYNGGATANVVAQIVNLTKRKVVASRVTSVTDTASPSAANFVLNFTPSSSDSYYVAIRSEYGGSNSLYVDKIVYGKEAGENTATIEVWNSSDSTSVDTKTITVEPTTAGTVVGTITWLGTAAKNYRTRVKRTSGPQRLLVDKSTMQTLANSDYVFDAVEFGQGSKVWLAAHLASAATDSQLFVYNTSTNAWDSTVTMNDVVNTQNDTIRALAHSDSLEYVVLDSDVVFTGTAAGVDDYYANFDANARDLVGGAVVQNRLVVMAEDSNGNTIASIPLDGAGVPYDMDPSAPDTGVLVETVPTGSKTPDTTLRARMASTPTGVRWFTNFTDATTKIFHSDLSETSISTTEIADLGHNVKATCIAYESGITFIGGLYYGSAGSAGSATAVDKLARPALWAIDQNGVVQRIGFFRRDDPAAGFPVDMEPFQQDLYILQSGIDKSGNQKGYVWRYSLVTGGLYCEYELPITTAANQRALCVIPGYIFAVYTTEILTAGSVATYRQSSVSGGSSITSSVYDFGLPAVNKSLTKVDVLTDTMPANTAVKVEYQIDQDGTWTLLGTATSGKRSTFFVDQVTFTTLQTRATLITTDGASTPVLRAVVAEAQAAEDEEYFDLVLRCEDDDSYDHTAANFRTGADRANALASAWRTGVPVTFVDGYNKTPGANDTYLVRVGDFRDERNAAGEGRTVVTLKVIR